MLELLEGPHDPDAADTRQKTPLHHGCCWEMCFLLLFGGGGGTFCLTFLLIVVKWLQSHHLASKIGFLAPLPTSTEVSCF